MNISRMKKAELVKVAEDAGLDATGTVKELRARIRADMEDEGPKEAETMAVPEDEAGIIPMPVPLEDIPEEDLKEPECPHGFHWYAEGGECVPDDAEADDEAVEAEIEAKEEVVTVFEEVPVSEEVVASCGNCGTDLARFHTFPDPETGKPRCPNCGRAQ